jgi:hypothetical protein
MKTIKSTIFFLLVLFSTTAFVTSCSKEDQTNNNVSENAKVSTYLKSFYATNYQLGKSVETKTKSNSSLANRSAEVENLVITEVFVGNTTTARGYIITDKDTNDFLYFIDVDRVNFKLTSADIVTNDVKIFDDINDLDKYIITNELDYIQIAEDYYLEQSSERRFWGWGEPHPSGECINGHEYWVHTYYVFGIGVSTVGVQNADHTGPLWSPCGEYVNP